VACHVIGGLAGAKGHVGPPLTHFKSKSFIAGRLPNTPPAVAHWIESPQRVLPGNLMPDLGVDPTEARDIAAYLYTQ
jgi:cytochrome c2